MENSIRNFREAFPEEDACLDYVFKRRFPHLSGYKKIKGRKAYSNAYGKQIYPLKGTIFERSSTSLVNWFYVIYLFSQSKNGVSAKEVQRHIGVTYKTAWRMCKLVRSLMEQPKGKLCGIVEADETYIGGTRRLGSWRKKKVPVLGVVERQGRVKAITIPDKSEFSVNPFIERNVRKGTYFFTDEAPVYKSMNRFKRGYVTHGKKEYVRGIVHTNSVEGFWGHLKPALKGTYRSVSKQYLQSYINEFVFRYNHRKDNIFEKLLDKI